MKKRILSITLGVLAFIGFGVYGESLNHYNINATVYAMDSTEVFFEDFKGDIWTWELEDGESYTIGDKVVLKMHTNYTEGVTDDMIRKIKRV